MSAHNDTAVTTAKINFDSAKFEEVSKENGHLVYKYSDDDAFVSMSPYSKKEVKAFEDYKAAYQAAAVEAAVDAVKKTMAKDSSIVTADVRMPYGTTSTRSIDVSIDREKVYKNMFAKEGEPAEIKTSRITVEVTEPGISKKHIKRLQSEFYASLNK
jgi:hypothetical protein